MSLSTRELEVLRLLVGGMTNREVAGSLGISVRTAEFHRENIRRKLDAHTRSELVVHARSLGLGAA